MKNLVRTDFLQNLILLSAVSICVSFIAWGSCLSPASVSCFQNGEWGDYKFHYQGWSSYYHGASWIPPYINSFTWPQRSSVMFTDSIPLAAILFKLIGRLLHLPVFNYFGILSILNGIVVSWSASRIGQYRGWNHIATISLGIVLITSSLSWSRLIHSHEALQLHGVILLSITYVIVREESFPKWLILSSLSLGIHPYYTPMVLVCMLSFLISDTSRLVPRLLVTIFFLLTSAYIFGFLPSSLSSGSPELWNANLLTLIDPQNHSAIFNSLPKREPYEYEGYAYLGLGVIIAFLVSFQCTRSDVSTSSLYPRVWIFSVFGLFLFSLGHTWNLGHTPITEYHLIYKIPGSRDLYDVFRSCGRFAWPLSYSVLIWIFDYISILKLPRIIFPFIVVLQLLDSNATIIFRQGTLFDGRHYKLTNPVVEWSAKNSQLAALLSQTSTFIVGNVLDKASLPPAYTPQYLNPAIHSNWGGEGITRLPSQYRPSKHTQEVFELVTSSLQTDSKSTFHELSTVVFTDDSDQQKQLIALAQSIDLNCTLIHPHYLLISK